MSIGYINPARNGGFFLLPLLTWCLRENLSNKKGLQEKTLKPLAIVMVPEVGIEPTWSCPRGILSPVRLPVSPLRRIVISYRKNSSPVNLYSSTTGAFPFFPQ